MLARSTRLAGAGILAAALLAGCGGSDGNSKSPVGSPSSSKSSDAEIGDACKIVTQADAERILGEKVEKSDFQSSAAAVLRGECVWTNVANDHGASLQFRVFNTNLVFNKDAFSAESGFESISDLGEDAYAISKDNDVSLSVLTGDSMIQLDASRGGGGFDPAAARTELITLAKRALAALS